MKKLGNWFVNNGPIILVGLALINAYIGEWLMASTNLLLSVSLISMNNNKNK